MDKVEYEKWRKGVNNHPVVKERGDKIVTKKEVDEIEKLSKINKWRVLRDSILIFLVLLILILFSFKIFYPENYKDLVEISHVCEPTVDGDTNTVFNNLTCQCGDNICPEFPDEIIVKIINSTD